MTCVGMAAMVNGLVSGGPPVGPGGIFSLGDPTVLEALAKGAGLTDVAVAELPTTFHADTIDAHLDRVSSLAGPLASAFAHASAEQLAAIRRTAAQMAADYADRRRCGAAGTGAPGHRRRVTSPYRADVAVGGVRPDGDRP